MTRRSSAAIDKLPDIVALEGIDAVVVGLADLASSLGHPGDGRHPEVRQAVDRIIRVASQSKGAVGRTGSD